MQNKLCVPLYEYILPGNVFLHVRMTHFLDPVVEFQFNILSDIPLLQNCPFFYDLLK